MVFFLIGFIFDTRAGSLKSYVQELLVDVLYILPLSVGTVVLAGIVYHFVFVRQGGVADDDDQDK